MSTVLALLLEDLVSLRGILRHKSLGLIVYELVQQVWWNIVHVGSLCMLLRI